MYCAAIAGDIIASTSLNDREREIIQEELGQLFITLRDAYDVYGRNTQGDYIVAVVPDPGVALRIALLLKSLVKSLPLHKAFESKPAGRAEKFHTYGIRLAIALGHLHRYDPDDGIIDGDAIYRAGRKINQYSTYGKKRVVIKDTLYLVSADMQRYAQFEPMLALIDELINKATARQCQVLHLRLFEKSETDIARQLRVSQPVVNKQSHSVGWNAIEKTLDYFEGTIKALVKS